MPGNNGFTVVSPPQFPFHFKCSFHMILTHCWGTIPKPHVVTSVIGIIGIRAEGRHRGSGLRSRDCGLCFKDRGLYSKGKGLGIRVWALGFNVRLRAPTSDPKP